MVQAAHAQIDFSVKFDQLASALATIQNKMAGIGINLEQISKKSTGVTSAFNSIGNIAKTVFTAVAGYISIRTIEGLITRTTEYAEQLKKQSSITGIATEKLAGLNLAVQQEEGSIEGLNQGLKSFQVNLGNLAGVSDKAKLAIKTLNLDVEKLQKMPIDEALLEVSDAFHKSTDATTKMTVAQALFGKGARDIIPFLNSGRDSIEGFMKKAHELGLDLTKDQVNALDEFSDSITLVKGAFTGIGISLVETLLPAMKSVVSWLDSTGIPTVTNWLKTVWEFWRQTDWLKTAWEYWRQTEAEGIRKIIAGLKSEISSYQFPIWGMSEAQLKNRQDLLNQLRAQEDLLRIVENATQDVTKSTDGLGESNKNLAKGLSNELAKGLIDENVAWSDLNISTDEYRDRADKVSIELGKIIDSLKAGNSLTMDQERLLLNVNTALDSGTTYYGDFATGIKMTYDETIRYNEALAQYISQLQEIVQLQILMSTGVWTPTQRNLPEQPTTSAEGFTQDYNVVDETAQQQQEQLDLTNEYYDTLADLDKQYYDDKSMSDRDYFLKREKAQAAFEKWSSKSTKSWTNAQQAYYQQLEIMLENAFNTIGNKFIETGGKIKVTADSMKKAMLQMIVQVLSKVIAEAVAYAAAHGSLKGGFIGALTESMATAAFLIPLITGIASTALFSADTGGYVDPSGKFHKLDQSGHFNVDILPDEYLIKRNQFGQILDYYGGSTRNGIMLSGGINLNIYGVTDVTSFRNQYKMIADELVDTLQKRIYLRG